MYHSFFHLQIKLILTEVDRSSPPEVFLRKGVLKICSNFTGERPWRSMGMGVLLQICCIFSEHLFLRTPLEGCVCIEEIKYCTMYDETNR